MASPSIKALTALIFALASIGLFACGGGDDSDSTASSAAATTSTPTAENTTGSEEELPILDDVAGDEHVRYAASPTGTLAYNVALAFGKAGKSTIEFVNPTNTLHNVVVEAPNGKTVAETEKIRRGRTSTDAVLKPVEYVIYCSVPGHRKAGMVGHLNVTP